MNCLTCEMNQTKFYHMKLCPHEPVKFHLSMNIDTPPPKKKIIPSTVCSLRERVAMVINTFKKYIFKVSFKRPMTFTFRY